MEWWMASLDPESCKKYNFAARWALRQTGVVRAPCEEFDPSDLAGTAKGNDVERTAAQMQDAKPDCQVELKSHALGKKAVDEELDLTVQHLEQWVRDEAIHQGPSQGRWR